MSLHFGIGASSEDEAQLATEQLEASAGMTQEELQLKVLEEMQCRERACRDEIFHLKRELSKVAMDWQKEIQDLAAAQERHHKIRTWSATYIGILFAHPLPTREQGKLQASPMMRDLMKRKRHSRSKRAASGSGRDPEEPAAPMTGAPPESASGAGTMSVKKAGPLPAEGTGSDHESFGHASGLPRETKVEQARGRRAWHGSKVSLTQLGRSIDAAEVMLTNLKRELVAQQVSRDEIKAAIDSGSARDEKDASVRTQETDDLQANVGILEKIVADIVNDVAAPAPL